MVFWRGSTLFLLCLAQPSVWSWSPLQFQFLPCYSRKTAFGIKSVSRSTYAKNLKMSYTSITASSDESVVGKVNIDPYIGTGLGTRREQYCAEMSNTIPNTQANRALEWIEDQTSRQLQMSFMLTGRLPSSLLQSLICMSKARNVLEIGTYTGYSAISMGATGACVTAIDSFEDEPESEAIFHQGVEMSGLKIQLKRGKALEVLALLAAEAAAGAEPFDFVFIDADKTEQIQYYELLIGDRALFADSGVIVVDNTLWYSRVLRPESADQSAETRGVLAFNEHVRRDSRSFVTMLPLRDGVTLIQRRQAH